MSNGDGGGGGFDFGSLFDALLQGIIAAVEAIISFLQALVSAIVSALNFLFTGVQDTFGFSFKSLGEVWQGLKKELDTIWKAVILASLKKLYNLYKTLQAWAQKLKAWLDKLHALMKKYQMLYFRKVIQLIQRARKILVIFRFFHLKFAQKLDGWLATIEGKITHYLVLVAQKENEVINWVNFIVDPLGHLKTFPLIAGFILALDVSWAGIFGTPFSRWFTGLFGRGQTGSIKTSTAATVADVQAGAGDAGKIAVAWPKTHAAFSTEVGGT